jgi:hypothetical protein
MVSTWNDVKQVMRGLLDGAPKLPRLVIECSSISLEGSAELRNLLAAKGIEYLAAPVSGNAKVIKAGRLSFVCSGPKGSFEQALPYLKMIGPAASWVGEGELARIVKICHNVFLGVVTQSLAEITVLAQKAGVPRHALLDFINQSVMGSTFTRYKTPAFVNLDLKVTFTPQLLRKDMDLGLDAGPQLRGADAACVDDARPDPADDRTRMDRAGLRSAAAAAGAVFGDRTQTRERGGRGWTFVGRWSLPHLPSSARLRRHRLIREARPHDHRVHARQLDRYSRARGRGEAAGTVEPAGRAREPRGRRRLDRLEGRSSIRRPTAIRCSRTPRRTLRIPASTPSCRTTR